MDKLLESIQNDLKKHRVVLYMKGTKLMPVCGFSAKVVSILNDLGVDFETRNVLENEELREKIKDFSKWPTLPQLYIDGKFIGGCDIVSELYTTGELKKLMTK